MQAIQQGYIFEESAAIMAKIIELISHVRKLKTEKQLSLKVPLTALTVTCADEHLLHKIQIHAQLIRGVTHAQELHFEAGAHATELQQQDENWIAIMNLKE